LLVLPLLRLPAVHDYRHIPAQLDQFLSLGNWLISTPISAVMIWATVSPTPGIVSISFTASETKGPALLLPRRQSSPRLWQWLL
jgi:hypothetical protein